MRSTHSNKIKLIEFDIPDVFGVYSVCSMVVSTGFHNIYRATRWTSHRRSEHKERNNKIEINKSFQ